MRIIGGKLKGIRLQAPSNLPVRPTTNIAKESLFNILNNYFDFEELSCLDLFSGTGNIAFELASRNAKEVVSVDRFLGCVSYIKEISKKYQLSAIKAVKADVFKYLEIEDKQYDFIFADPPYDMSNPERVAQLIFDRKLLNEEGLLVIEHASAISMENVPHFSNSRKYGQSTFSFFEYKQL